MAIGTPTAVINFNVAAVSSGSRTPGTIQAGYTVFGTLFCNSFATLSSITDTSGNVYIVGTGISDSLGGTLYFFYSISIATPITGNINFTLSGTAAHVSWRVETVFGVNGVDLYGTGSSGTGTSPSYTTGILSQSNELIYGAFVLPSGSFTTWAQSSGFTNLDTGPGSIGLADVRLGYQLVSGTTSVIFNPTLGASRPYIINTITFTAANVVNQTVAVSSSGSAARRLSLGKSVQPTSSENVLLIRTLSPVIGTFLVETVNVLFSFPRTVSIFNAEHVVVAIQRTRTFSISLFEAVRALKIPALIKSVVTTENVFADKTFSTSGSSPKISQANAVSVLKAVGKPLTVSQQQVIGFIYAVGKIIRSFSSQTVNFIRILPREFSIASPEFASVKKSAVKLFSVTSAEKINLGNKFQTAIRTSLAQTVNLLKVPAKVLSVTSPETVKTIRSEVHQMSVSSPDLVASVATTQKTFTTSLLQAVATFASNTKFVLPSVSSGENVSLQKTVFKIIGAVSTQAVSVLKNLPKVFSTLLSEGVSEKLQVGKPIKVVNPEHISILAGLRRITGTVLVESVSLRKTIFKAIGTVLFEAISAIRSNTAPISTASSESAGLLLTAGKAIGTFLSQSVSFMKSQGFNHNLSISVAQTQSVLSALRAFGRRNQILSIFYKKPLN